MSASNFQFQNNIIQALFPKICWDGKSICGGKTVNQIMSKYFKIYIFLLHNILTVFFLFIIFSVDYERKACHRLASSENDARNILNLMDLFQIDGKY